MGEKTTVKNWFKDLWEDIKDDPKGDYPKYVKGDKSSLKAMRGYEEKEKHAYRKMLTTMARKAVNKETNASNYINYYRL